MVVDGFEFGANAEMPAITYAPNKVPKNANLVSWASQDLGWQLQFRDDIIVFLGYLSCGIFSDEKKSC